MGWVLIPASHEDAVTLHTCTDSVDHYLKNCSSAHHAETHYDSVSSDIAYVSVKNSKVPNMRARALLAEEMDEQGEHAHVCGPIAVVAACNTLPYGYAELLWCDCESIRDYLLYPAIGG